MVSLSETDQSETIICSTPANLKPRLRPKVPSEPSIFPRPVSQAESTMSLVFLRLRCETSNAVSIPFCSAPSLESVSLPVHAQLPPLSIIPLQTIGLGL